MDKFEDELEQTRLEKRELKRQEILDQLAEKRDKERLTRGRYYQGSPEDSTWCQAHVMCGPVQSSSARVRQGVQGLSDRAMSLSSIAPYKRQLWKAFVMSGGSTLITPLRGGGEEEAEG